MTGEPGIVRRERGRRANPHLGVSNELTPEASDADVREEASGEHQHGSESEGDAQRNLPGEHAQNPSERPMISFMISFVPP